jgi:hypothetical protein
MIKGIAGLVDPAGADSKSITGVSVGTKFETVPETGVEEAMTLIGGDANPITGSSGEFSIVYENHTP